MATATEDTISSTFVEALHSDIPALKARAHQIRPDLPTDAVIDVLVHDYQGRGTIYSPATVAEQAQAHVNPALVLATLLLLATEPLHVLNGHWLYIDDDGELFSLNADQVTEAVQQDQFYHPLSGNRVYDFQKSIRLIYEAI